MKQKRTLTSEIAPVRLMIETPITVPEAEPFAEPRQWTIVSAMNRVLDLARGSKLEPDFWTKCAAPLAYLRQALDLSDIQIVFLAVLIEAGEAQSWRKFGKFLGCSRLSVMVYSEELEGLVKKRWVVPRPSREDNRFCEGFGLVHGVVTAIRHNERFVPEKIDGLSEQEFVDRLEQRFEHGVRDLSGEYSEDSCWMRQLIEANPQLPLCRELLKLDDRYDRYLLLLFVRDYALWADSPQEGLGGDDLDMLLPDDFQSHVIRRCLSDGTHLLLRSGYVENACNDGLADTERFRLSLRAKSELLADYTPSRSACPRKGQVRDRRLKKHSAIGQKPMFYNPTEQEQIARLTSMLQQENFASIQERLAEEGMRKGFACLFYGAPGTGKTETVLQIARQTGRDVMQIDIAGIRDKFVGESEKNIKEVFNRYRELCRDAETVPILFFNEADGIFSKRFENVKRSVEKMDNAMQNIILQELETLEGILIATTNLTQTLDGAFERRFLFKVEFRNPEVDVKAKIWEAMLKDIGHDEAMTLAGRFDFTGGQIENVARKRTIDYILSGKHASLEELEGICRDELLNRDRKGRHVGFAV